MNPQPSFNSMKGRIISLSPERRAWLEKQLRERQRPRLDAISPRNPGDFIPVSYNQKRLWFIEQFQPDTPLYNVARAVRCADH
ncbi:MAG: hypothetical protein U1D30_11820 [Planctomycetota bacterium]